MSEEILKALMQLFGLIAKQDGGVQKNEIEYVRNFLKQQLSANVVEEYFALFQKYCKDKRRKVNVDSDAVQLTSMKDSVKILGICKKINKKLNREQKVVVLVRMYELINADRHFTDQRMAIINTAADVFNFSDIEKKEIETFVIKDDISDLDFSNMLVVNSDEQENLKKCQHIKSGKLDGNCLILYVKRKTIFPSLHGKSGSIFKWTVIKFT